MIWLLSSFLFALLFVHPFVVYPLSLLLLRRWLGNRPSGPTTSGPRVPVDIVFCAHNEARVIEAKLANCVAIVERYPDVRLHVYDDGSTDGTAAVIERHRSRLRAVLSPERTGKSVGMNRLLAGCRGEIVVFTDANVTLDVEGFAHLYRYFTDSAIGCVCGRLVYMNAEESATSAMNSLYWRLDGWLKTLEDATGSVMGAAGAIFAIRRRLFREVPADIIDDMFTSLSILCDSYRVVQAPELLAFKRSATSPREEFRRKIRIACRSFNCHRLLWPRLRRLGALDLYKYLSHKLLRWLAIVWLVLALLTAEAFLATLGLAGPGLVALALAAASIVVAGRWLRIRPAQALLDLIGALAATGYGVWRSLKGDRFHTWELARTAR